MPHATTQHLPPPLQKLLAPLLSQEPAAQLIRSTARQQWRLLAVNLGSSVLEALSEGATLAVVFLGGGGAGHPGGHALQLGDQACGGLVASSVELAQRPASHGAVHQPAGVGGAAASAAEPGPLRQHRERGVFRR